MSLDGRLDRLMPALSARERVALVVRAVYADRPHDPALLASMTPEQGREYNRLIGLARGIQRILLPHALVLQGAVEALELKHLLLTVLAAWGSERSLLLASTALVAHIPIAQSEYDALVAEARDSYLPLAEAAEIVADERGISERAATLELRGQLLAGKLRSRGRGGGVEFKRESLHAWLGLSDDVLPEWGWRYEPVPDERFAAERWRREGLERDLAQSAGGPGAAWRVLPALGGKAAAPVAELGQLDLVMRTLAEQIRGGLLGLWAHLRAIETVLGELVAEFDDDAVAPEELSVLLADSRERLEGLFAEAPRLVGPCEPAKPDEATVRQLREHARAVARP